MTPSTGGSSGTGGAGTGGSGGTGGSVGGGSALPPAAACPAVVAPCVPTVLDTGIGGPGTFQLQGGYLFWRNSGGDGLGREPNSVQRLLLPSGPPELVASLGDGSVATIATDAAYVYIGDSALGVARVPLAGGTLEYLSDNPALSVAVDDANVYFTTSGQVSPGAVAWLPKAGGELSGGVTQVSNPVLIAVDATHVYWSADAATGAVGRYGIYRAPKGTGEVAVETVVAELVMRPERLVVIDGQVYLSASLREAATGTRGAILRVPATGGEPVELAASTDSFGAVAADTERFYVATCPAALGTAAIYAMPHAGGALTPIAQGGTCYAGVAVDASTVYAADWGGPDYEITATGSVVAADKCGCL